MASDERFSLSSELPSVKMYSNVVLRCSFILQNNNFQNCLFLRNGLTAPHWNSCMAAGEKLSLLISVVYDFFTLFHFVSQNNINRSNDHMIRSPLYVAVS